MGKRSLSGADENRRCVDKGTVSHPMPDSELVCEVVRSREVQNPISVEVPRYHAITPSVIELGLGEPSETVTQQDPAGNCDIHVSVTIKVCSDDHVRRVHQERDPCAGF